MAAWDIDDGGGRPIELPDGSKAVRTGRTGYVWKAGELEFWLDMDNLPGLYVWSGKERYAIGPMPSLCRAWDASQHWWDGWDHAREYCDGSNDPEVVGG